MGCISFPESGERPAAENDYVALHNKHNFTVSHMGVLLGMVYNNLEQLKLHSCNDFFRCDTQAMSVISGLPRLRVLHLEEVQVRFTADSVSELGALPQVRGDGVFGPFRALPRCQLP